MKHGNVLLVAVLGASCLATALARADKPAGFGILHPPAIDDARQQALAWLRATGRETPAVRQQVETIWHTDAPVLNKVSQTLALGDPRAARLLQEVTNPTSSAPTALPHILLDDKQPSFYRANLALAYARGLCARRAFEDALATLRLVKPTQVVDPAAYLFHRAVAEHALLLKNEATQSIQAVLEDVPNAPERYKMVALLMLYDLQTWRAKDLGTIARKMDNIQRRLELARGGPKTQKMEREVVARLDELIKKLENQAKGSSANGGNCPGSQDGSGGSNTGSPMQDSGIATLPGQGMVSMTKLTKLAEHWGKLPEKERTKAMRILTRDLPPQHRELVERYFKQIAELKRVP